MTTHNHLRLSANYKNRDSEIQATNIAVVFFIEDDVHIAYAPALDLSGYGATEKEARQSFEVVLEEFIKYTTTKKTLTEELKRLGWDWSRN